MSAPLDLDALKHGPLRDGLCWDCDGEYGARPIVDNLCYVNALIAELEACRVSVREHSNTYVQHVKQRAERAEAEFWHLEELYESEKQVAWRLGAELAEAKAAIARVESAINRELNWMEPETRWALNAALRGDR